MKMDVSLWLPGAISPYLPLGDPQLSAMGKLLSLSNKQPCRAGFDETLSTYFSGLSGEIPKGALGAVSHGLIEKTNKQTWCLASPVTCVATHNTVMLCPPSQLQLNAQEIGELSQLLNQHLNRDNVQLTAINGSEWYCQLQNNLDVVMNDLLDALSKNMIHYHPSGPDQAYWRRLITECQILLQTCTVNQKRTQLNLPLISSLWFSGLGTLPASLKTDFEVIYTNESLMKGLALCAECPVESFESVDGLFCQKKKILIADFTLERQLKEQDETTWLQSIMHYEKNLFSPLIKAVSKNQIATLTCHFNDGYVYRLTKNPLKYFWRKFFK